MNSIAPALYGKFGNAKKEEDLFSEELAWPETVQGLVSWSTRGYQFQMQVM